LDFDSSKSINLDRRIKKAARKTGVDVREISIKKNTDTTKRYIVHYETDEGQHRLKIETSFRRPPKQSEVVEKDGLQMYAVDRILDQKLSALENRTTARDLCDVHFLATRYPEIFSQNQIDWMETLQIYSTHTSGWLIFIDVLFDMI